MNTGTESRNELQDMEPWLQAPKQKHQRQKQSGEVHGTQELLHSQGKCQEIEGITSKMGKCVCKANTGNVIKMEGTAMGVEGI